MDVSGLLFGFLFSVRGQRRVAARFVNLVDPSYVPHFWEKFSRGLDWDWECDLCL